MTNITSILTNEKGDGKDLVDFARNTAETLTKDLTRSQIRNVFTEVRKIEAVWWTDPERLKGLRRLNMLKPKLAYQGKRNNINPLFEKTIGGAIDAVTQAESAEARDARFERFIDLFEAILAYHHSLGGRK